MLRIEGLTKRFGGVVASDDIALDIPAGQLHAIIGPNGAGKTTLIGQLSGELVPDAGRVHFDGQDITPLPAYERSALGLARTFQIVQPFPKMTVLENTAAGALFSGGAAGVDEARAVAREYLAFTGLADVADRPAAALTLASRKRLELAKSLAMKPRLLMLDEVNAGLNPTEITEALDIIRKIARQGVTIIVIEHLMMAVDRIQAAIDAIVPWSELDRGVRLRPTPG